MNKNDRKKLFDITSQIEQLASEVDAIREEFEVRADNLYDSFPQRSEEIMDDADALTEIYDMLEEAREEMANLIYR